MTQLPFPADSFVRFLRRKARLSRKEIVRFDVRTYQVRATRAALRALAKGSNAIVDLPTGAGKTNIAFLSSARFTLVDRPNSKKILYVVPTRVLVEQVSHAATWLSPELYRVAVTDRLVGNRWDLKAAIERASLVITTPGLFASQLRAGAIDRHLFNSQLGFVVVDEFDEFLTIDPTERGYQVRFEQDFQELLIEIGTPPLLLMSGTAPKTASKVVQSFTAGLLARFVDDRFHPVVLNIPERSYKDYIPVAHVHLVPVHDDFVSGCDAALGYAQNKLILDYECDSDVRLDRDYLMERLAAIASGTIGNVRYLNGSYGSVDSELRALCRKLLSLVNKYTFLFEDMFAGFSVEIRRARLVIECEEKDKFIDVPILVDDRGHNEFWPSLQGKAEALARLVTSQKRKRGVVFTRNIRLSDELAKLFAARGTPVLKLDGRLSGGLRFAQIRKFRSSSMLDGILIITRTTGKRGLDIPAADYVVVYSPKEDEYVMWQELSRIRSTLGKGKPSYILYYAGTAEHDKLTRLTKDMQGSANRYSFETR